MREKDTRSLEIIDVIGDAARNVTGKCLINIFDEYGERQIECPQINYVYGNSQYVKERLTELTQGNRSQEFKFPLIALFVPLTEQRGTAEYHSKAKLRILIACSTDPRWNNEQRKHISFERILRPIYEQFLKNLLADPRVKRPYNGGLPHEYSENYSYGRYGAYDSTGEKLRDSIDAINITNLEIIIKNHNCTSR